MKTLLGLRHAKSSWSDTTVDDRDRDLNARGRRDAVRMGELIRQNQLSPDVIISSDALRARLTAEAVADVIGFQEAIALDRRLYLASPADIVAVIRTAAGAASTVMIVGHNPGLEQLVERLTGEPNDLPTAALAQIELPIDQWRDLTVSTQGHLVDLWRPKELNED